MILKEPEGTHHATASSMLAAVEMGCRVCTCVWLECTDDCNIDAEKAFNMHCEDPFSEFYYNHRLNSLGFDISGQQQSSWYLEPLASRKAAVPRIDLFEYQNDPTNLMIQYWKLARGWLSECLSHHTRCKHVTSVEDYSPTRLIDVRANSSKHGLRLHSTSNGPINEPYMTLSHCWGEYPCLRLTSSTHDRLQEGFALAELPSTFQDAIMVTRALGINFLWIDALCIIQDSVLDWRHEAALMSQVYSNSRCNISALGARNSTEGLFFDRKLSTIPYCTFAFVRKYRPKRAYEFAHTDVWSDSVRNAPLPRRAWVLQECLLAPRVLHFGRKQLLWECNELRACEVYPRRMHYGSSPKHGGYIHHYLKNSFAAIIQGDSDSTLTFAQVYQTWAFLVQHYSSCDLTKSEDKLVAISGLVKRLQPLFKTDYLAGLWKDDLLQQLLWHVESYDKAGRSLSGEKRPEYRAPSWSWASIDARIVLHQQSEYLKVSHMATIIEAHVTPVTEDITGQILNGYIRLRATLFPLKVGESTELGYLSLRLDWERLASTYDAVPDVWPQSAVEGLQFVPLLMTWFSRNAEADPPEVYGLIIQAVEGKQGVYQRWGYLQYPQFRGSEKAYSTLGLQLINGFGLRLINGEWTYNPPEKYAERIMTLI